VLTLWRSTKRVGYSRPRSGRRFGLMPLRSDYQITFHQSPFDALTLAQSGPLTFHFSPILPLSLLTNHVSLLTAALAAQRCAVAGIAALATSWPPMKTGESLHTEFLEDRSCNYRILSDKSRFERIHKHSVIADD
jgi:hypothetical protein